MSWIHKLHETYERCVGHEPDGGGQLMPVSHTSQLAHIEVAIDGLGNYRRARVAAKEVIVLPATEQSANRTSGEAPHPLCDKIQYCAGDYSDFGGAKKSYFASYLSQLEQWCASGFGHAKAKAVLEYVRKRSVVADLVGERVLHARDHILLTDWREETPEPEIFRQLTPKKVKNDLGEESVVTDQGDALIRWVVETPGDACADTWADQSLQAAWCGFYANQQSVRGFCMATGNAESVLAEQHPAKLRHSGDKAKLISSNDTSGYTFRGKFLEADEAVGVGFDVTQKAHNALRWLIARQGHRNGKQVIVSWQVAGKPIPDPFANTLELFGFVGATDVGSTSTDTAQAFALRLNKALAGYRANLDATDDIVVMGLDSATDGRMAITFYRELKGSEFLERVEEWHTLFAWPQNFGKDSKFIGAPAPRDIAEAAYGTRLDDKLRKATVERLLPCIVDSVPVPRDLVESVRRRAANRVGLDPWEWEKCLGIACALYKGYHKERNYQMALEPDRTNRDYLYGRLLAIAEHIEGRALHVAGEKRDTTAARLMQRFADRPYSTWKTIELSLTPYKTRLRTQRASFLYEMEKLLDAVMVKFAGESFVQDVALCGEFLLGYHCQRQALRPDGSATAKDQSTETND